MKKTTSRSFALDDAGTVTCDIEELLESRLLVQANSGGGKSFLLRRILEQTNPHVQQLVFDIEGDFSTLREKFHYVHAAAKGGDTIVNPRSAALLMERLLQLKASAVLDLYELPKPQRALFVKHAIEWMMEAPKKYWQPVMVVIDEAHLLCPQDGSAASVDAVIDLCARGRKREFCAILATQRIAKVHKDAVAELTGRLVGRTRLDIDIKRAADDLGFPKARHAELSRLHKGSFFASGPAFNLDSVQLVKIGGVQTTHPRAGKRATFRAPPPTSKIAALLPQLADLPAEAEKQHQSFAELSAEIASLRKQLAAKPATAPPKPVEVPVFPPAAQRELKESINTLHSCALGVDALVKKLTGDALTLAKATECKAPARADAGLIPALLSQYRSYSAPASASKPKTRPDRPAQEPSDSIPKGQMQLLVAIAQNGSRGVSRPQLSALTGYGKSSRDTYLSRLRSGGLVNTDNSDAITITPEGIGVLGTDFTPLPTGRALREYWLNRLPLGEKTILSQLMDVYPAEVTRDELSRLTGYGKSSRDTYLSRLSTKKLTEPAGHKHIRAAVVLFGDE